MDRKEEVRRLLSMSVEEMVKKSQGRLEVLPTLEDLHNHLAESIANEIEENNKKGSTTKLILPVGPTGQYPILKDLIHKRKVSLRNCYFFFMDEYCDDNGHAIPKDHPLSFKGIMERLFFKHIDPELNIPEDQVIFPDHSNIQNLQGKIKDVGGIDTVYGGIGIHGHVAFNEPEENVKNSQPRLVYLNPYTITINAVRDEVGGNLINFPRKALTLGIKQIMDARRIRLYCRNDIPTLDWANTILRLTVFGEPADDYPVTYLREHRDYKVITDRNTANPPKYIL